MSSGTTVHIRRGNMHKKRYYLGISHKQQWSNSETRQVLCKQGRTDMLKTTAWWGKNNKYSSSFPHTHINTSNNKVAFAENTNRCRAEILNHQPAFYLYNQTLGVPKETKRMKMFSETLHPLWCSTHSLYVFIAGALVMRSWDDWDCAMSRGCLCTVIGFLNVVKFNVLFSKAGYNTEGPDILWGIFLF